MHSRHHTYSVHTHTWSAVWWYKRNDEEHFTANLILTSVHIMPNSLWNTCTQNTPDTNRNLCTMTTSPPMPTPTHTKTTRMTMEQSIVFAVYNFPRRQRRRRCVFSQASSMHVCNSLGIFTQTESHGQWGVRAIGVCMYSRLCDYNKIHTTAPTTARNTYNDMRKFGCETKTMRRPRCNQTLLIRIYTLGKHFIFIAFKLI